jgi:hypothetical protein
MAMAGWAAGSGARDWTDGCIAVTNAEMDEIWGGAGWYIDRDPALGRSAARGLAAEFFQLEERRFVPMGEIGAAWAQWSLAASRIALNPQPLQLLFLCGQHRGRRPGEGATSLLDSGRPVGSMALAQSFMYGWNTGTQAEPDAT